MFPMPWIVMFVVLFFCFFLLSFMYKYFYVDFKSKSENMMFTPMIKLKW